MTRTLLRIGLLPIIIGLGLIAPAAQAGGWAAVILDSLPVEPHAGEKIRIGFTVRQHGLTPTNTVTPYLEADNQTTGESLRVNARQEGPVGHFVVGVTFPSPGVWRWHIHPEPFGAFPKDFEPLTVLPPAANASAGFLTDSPAIRWGATGLSSMLIAGLALAVQRGALGKKIGYSVAGVLLALLLAGPFVWPVVNSSAAEKDKIDTLPPTANYYGRALYVAKGCLACHMYRGIRNSVPGPVIGPNLTDYQADPAYLREWLRDPQALKPNTRMPNLNLSDDEIEALIAFLEMNPK